MGPTELYKKVVCAPLLLRSLESLVDCNYYSPFFLAAFYEISMVLIRLFGAKSERPPIPSNEISASDFNPSHNCRVKISILL